MDVRSLAIAIGFKVNNSNVKQVEQTTKKVKTGLERVGDSADKAGNKVDSLFSKLSGLAMFAGVSLTLGSIVKTIDEWKVIEGQVNNVTKSQQESKASRNQKLFKKRFTTLPAVLVSNINPRLSFIRLLHVMRRS